MTEVIFSIYLIKAHIGEVLRKFKFNTIYVEKGSRKHSIYANLVCEGAVYLTSLRRPTDIGLQLGKACYPCSG